MTRPLRVIWAYDREHTLHPFIVLGLNTLAEAGFEATVVSADKAEGAAYRSFDDFSFAERVRKFQHLVHKVRLDLEKVAVRHALAAEKARKPIRWAAEGKVKPPTPKERRRLLRRALWEDLQVNAIQAWRAVLKEYGNVRRLNWDTWAIYLKGFRRLMSLEGDVMIASRPEAAFWAAITAKLKGMRLVYFPFELYGEQIVKPMPFLLWFERFMLRHMVDAVLTQNDCRSDVLEKERGSRVKPLLVHNYKPIHWDHRPGGKLRARHGIAPDKKIVLYEGVVVDGRWLEFVAQSVVHLPDDVVLILMGQEKLKWRQVHAEQIKDALETGRLILAPPVPHEELHDYVADADVGIITYDDTVRNNVFCEPGKLSDYISVGVPVVAPNFPTIGPVVQGYGIGRCFDGHSPEAIAATLVAVLERPKAAWSEALQRACAELTWETQAPNLLAAVTGGVRPAGKDTCVASEAACEGGPGPLSAIRSGR